VAVPSGRLVIRPWVAADAAALGAAVTASVDHLRPWMPWVRDEPLSEAARRELIEKWRGEWEAGESSVFGILFPDGTVVGGCGLHRRRAGRPEVVEIGYWVHVDHTRRGIATEAAAALTDAAFTLRSTSEVEIHHQPANVASGAVPARLGYRHIGDEQAVTPFDEVERTMRVWAVDRASWQARRNDR